MEKPWTYEGYWNVVFGARTPRDVVNEYGLTAAQIVSLAEWVGFAQADAWMHGGQGADQPAEWDEYRERALVELALALDVMCECGGITGVPCEWSGDRNDMVTVEWMPECWRASHQAADGNFGVYPHNGAERFRCERSCAERIVEDSDEWARIL